MTTLVRILLGGIIINKTKWLEYLQGLRLPIDWLVLRCVEYIKEGIQFFPEVFKAISLIFVCFFRVWSLVCETFFFGEKLVCGGARD